MKKRLKASALFSIVTSLALLTTGCGAGSQPAAGDHANHANGELGKKRIALVMQFNIGTFSSQYVAGVKEQAEKLGGEVVVFNSDSDLAKMASNLDQAVVQHFDGILIDHGTAEALQQGVQKAVAQNIPVVAFDAALKIPGVTVLEQGDQKMAESTLEKLATDAGGKGNIVKIWVAGFAPMERRQESYKAFQAKYPEIKEVAAFGSATANTALDTQAQMEAILKKYPNKGDITAVWAAWDEFAKGATRAIQQAGRNEIKVYGIDLSDEDLQMIQDPNSPWIASAAVDPSDIGRVQVRYLYKKFKGEETPDNVALDPILVTREALPKEQVKMTDLSKFIEGWGQSKLALEPWMTETEAKK
ncbi:sugar ABC transporter substrate-binding protein [Brevibacillus dissolubilis]|uniref:sugar ABC transporter substrate-binding protein n=1 Tax=Brevibacillus dissolubilis TaxID=1844116 RepID=UPI0011178349|nr:sugar ABC transporter substrate-binding protein [Brevibacillus dissolubilis]